MNIIKISDAFLRELAQYIDKRCVSADYTINAKTYPAKLRRSLIDGKTVRKHVYLTQENPLGTVTRCRLFGENGEVLAERNDPRTHEQGKGLLLEFKFIIQEGE